MIAYWTDTRSSCCNALIVERPYTDCFAGYMPSFACYRCNRKVPRPDVKGLAEGFKSITLPFFEPSLVVHPIDLAALVSVQPMIPEGYDK